MNTTFRTILVLALLSFSGSASFAIEEPSSVDILNTPSEPQPTAGAGIHGASGLVGNAAHQAGEEFVKGLRQIAQPFVVVGRTVKNGVKYTILRGAQGIVFVSESLSYGLGKIAEGIEVIAIETAAGVRWVTVQAIKAGKLVIDEAVKTVQFVIDGVIYVAAQVGEKFVYVTQKALELAVRTGRLVYDGVTYVYNKTVDGVIWVNEQIVGAFRATYLLARNTFVAYRIRRKLTTSLWFGIGIKENMEYFRQESTDPDADPATRRLAESALEAAEAYVKAMKK
jgi:hypothetical protein